MDRQTKIAQLVKGLGRTSPFVVTEYHLPEKESLLDNIELKIGFTTKIGNMVQPYSLYDILKQHAYEPDKTIMIEMDVLTKDLGYWGILEGAMGLEPDGELAEVRYAHYPPFTYRGKLIICTSLSQKQIKRRTSMEFITRYCQLI